VQRPDYRNNPEKRKHIRGSYPGKTPEIAEIGGLAGKILWSNSPSAARHPVPQRREVIDSE
jgi:hypothetical protein